MESEIPSSDHGYYGEDEDEDDDNDDDNDEEEEEDEEEDETTDDVLLALFRQRTGWTDWGTLQHEAALGCRVGWREWLVAFSPAWESPFLVFDCGRAEEFVWGLRGVEELWDGVGGRGRGRGRGRGCAAVEEVEEKGGSSESIEAGEDGVFGGLACRGGDGLDSGRGWLSTVLSVFCVLVFLWGLGVNEQARGRDTKEALDYSDYIAQRICVLSQSVTER
ncbi:uncharacterized protein BKCO1_35000119 [Diplodia corticola]|uniref:Uncharacterized protein n=1 Tax=Diplodia corticola TaxID=236234 RepID=A0A1J9RJZ3_9PEZI|nr:uncharacterized protein BKCO1_35000119 [Diplodia corticola]OJD32891.1 hypothetical protein BKCO1_35000119 [Diplodia corticola]